MEQDNASNDFITGALTADGLRRDILGNDPSFWLEDILNDVILHSESAILECGDQRRIRISLVSNYGRAAIEVTQGVRSGLYYKLLCDAIFDLEIYGWRFIHDFIAALLQKPFQE